MDLLLDTHALLWWMHRPRSLSRRAREAIGDAANRIYVSPVSAMEIATKNRRRQLEYDTPLAGDFSAQIALENFQELPVLADHAELAGSLEGHNDPWDRLLAAQSRIERIALVTKDGKIADFGVTTFW